MLVRVDGDFVGLIGAGRHAAPRHATRSSTGWHRSASAQTIMLTGDNEAVAPARSPTSVGITDVRAGLLPEDKLEAIDALMRQHGQVAMVGDGVNDAPAMARATIGIAMGGAGTDVALETADVALMGDDLSRLPFAIALSRASHRIIQQNLWVAFGVVAC